MAATQRMASLGSAIAEVLHNAISLIVGCWSSVWAGWQTYLLLFGPLSEESVSPGRSPISEMKPQTLSQNRNKSFGKL